MNDAESPGHDHDSALPDLRETPHAPPSRLGDRGRDAQAYARLLVSDIRLYHDMDVVMGRAAADLAARLEVPLREARARFRARFADDPAFDREVVTVLAGGDARRLGPPRD
jgi:hypothetical protein